MSTLKFALLRGSAIRWLIAATSVLGSVMIPLSANANQGNDVVEILASAAVAYVIVDAVGGFDDGDDGKDRRHDRGRHRDDRYVSHHGGSHRSRDHDRRYRDRNHRDSYYGHRHNQRHSHHGHARKHRADHRWGSGRSGHHRRGKHQRYRAYH